ncbi:MAG: segregation/condensation protein A [Actinomycetia bacterium]|nr:segregation/condensation protein A [Actinomycetes bacterium]
MLIVKKKRKYQVKFDIYEGPFDLLIDLISKKKIDIYDVPLKKITSEYISYLEKMKEFDLEIASEFLLLAATLMEMKASSLFPSQSFLSPIETEIDFPENREELIKRLIEYKTFKNISLELKARLDAESKYFTRIGILEEKFVNLLPDFYNRFTLNDLCECAAVFLLSYKDIDLTESIHVIPKPISVEERKKIIIKKIIKSKKTTFSELIGMKKKPIEIITLFLALLDLHKEGKILIKQEEMFGDLDIIYNGGK